MTARINSRAKRRWPSHVQAAAIALLGSCLALSQAFGQAQPPTSSAPTASSAAPISDQKLKATAAAIPQVEGLRENYQQQLAQAPAADRGRIEGQAKDAMSKAITDQGLSIDEYNSVVQAAQSDPQIRERLIQQLPQSDHAPGP